MRWINLCSCWIQQIILWSKAVIRIWTSNREMDQRLNSEGQIWKNADVGWLYLRMIKILWGRFCKALMGLKRLLLQIRMVKKISWLQLSDLFFEDVLRWLYKGGQIWNKDSDSNWLSRFDWLCCGEKEGWDRNVNFKSQQFFYDRTRNVLQRWAGFWKTFSRWMVLWRQLLEFIRGADMSANFQGGTNSLVWTAWDLIGKSFFQNFCKFSSWLQTPRRLESFNNLKFLLKQKRFIWNILRSIFGIL